MEILANKRKSGRPQTRCNHDLLETMSKHWTEIHVIENHGKMRRHAWKKAEGLFPIEIISKDFHISTTFWWLICFFITTGTAFFHCKVAWFLSQKIVYSFTVRINSIRNLSLEMIAFVPWEKLYSVIFSIAWWSHNILYK